MHPSRAFAWEDAGELRAFVAAMSFAQISAAIDGRVMTAQAPLAVCADGAIAFHLARANPLVPHLDGAELVAAVLGEHAYISPDWYGTADQVPTWNYRLVEITGRARRLDESALRPLLDTLSATHEARLAPKQPWTADKMDPARLAAMLKAIVGFAIDAPMLRGIQKLGQNKKPEERAGAVAALGQHAMAALMTPPPSPLQAEEK